MIDRQSVYVCVHVLDNLFLIKKVTTLRTVRNVEWLRNNTKNKKHYKCNAFDLECQDFLKLVSGVAFEHHNWFFDIIFPDSTEIPLLITIVIVIKH
jgi:hypothetical protein